MLSSDLSIRVLFWPPIYCHIKNNNAETHFLLLDGELSTESGYEIFFLSDSA